LPGAPTRARGGEHRAGSSTHTSLWRGSLAATASTDRPGDRTSPSGFLATFSMAPMGCGGSVGVVGLDRVAGRTVLAATGLDGRAADCKIAAAYLTASSRARSVEGNRRSPGAFSTGADRTDQQQTQRRFCHLDGT